MATLMNQTNKVLRTNTHLKDRIQVHNVSLGRTSKQPDKECLKRLCSQRVTHFCLRLISILKHQLKS